MRHLNEYQHHLRVLLEPYDAKVSRTVLRGESPSNGADLLDIGANIDQKTKKYSVLFILFFFMVYLCVL